MPLFRIKWRRIEWCNATLSARSEAHAREKLESDDCNFFHFDIVELVDEFDEAEVTKVDKH